MELYKTNRPRRFKDVIGQESAVAQLTEMVKNKDVDHALMFTGASGCGKTTLARILVKKLGCISHDFKEINAAQSRGIDTVRDIDTHLNRSALGDCKVFLIDECHQLTKEAQNGLLKLLEDAPDFVYFMLCTTDTAKMIRTIMTRCTEIRVSPLKPKTMEELLLKVIASEKATVTQDVVDRLVEVAEGSARKALVLLGQVYRLKSEDDMLEAISSSDIRPVAFDLVKAMMPFKGKPQWSEVSKVLAGLKDEEPEGIRQLVLAVCATHMLKGGPMAGRAYDVFNAFRDDFYTTRKAGLVGACFEVVHPR